MFDEKKFDEDFERMRRFQRIFFRVMIIAIVILLVGGVVFTAWAITGPCSKPLLEAPSWCVSLGGH